MNMDRNARARRRRLMMIVGVVTAFVAGASAFFLSNQGSTTDRPMSTRDVLVARQSIPARSVIGADQVAVRQMSDDAALGLALSEPSQAVGMVAAVAIFANQPITANLLTTTTAGVSQILSILGPTETISTYSPAWRAVSIEVAPANALAGMIEVGQRVDLIATVPISIRVESETGELIEGTTRDGFYTDASTKGHAD